MEVTVSDAAPAGLNEGGRRLWASLLAQDDGLIDRHEPEP
jgi:hypothetical protein